MLSAGRVPGEPTYSLNYSADPFGFTVSRVAAGKPAMVLFSTGTSPMIFKVGTFL